MTLEQATRRLADAGCDTARLDAELLLAHALGVTRTAVVAGAAPEPDEDALARFDALVTRRERREPVAYLLGVKGFRHIDLEVDARVLVPRPETEHLVEAALGLPRGARVCDVGTGSGAVALALKHERPDLWVMGTDISRDALSVAKANAQRLGLDVEFLQSDLLGSVEGDVDAVVSNPPYVRRGDPLPPDVHQFEPHVALYAGEDGLDVIRRLVPEAVARRARFLALEVGEGQAHVVGQLLRNLGYANTETVRDLAGIERVVVGWRA